MNEKRIHSKTAIREAKSDAKKEERIGSVMDEINERLPLQESINAPWPPRVSSGATISSSPSSTLPGSRATYVPPDLKEIMQLASWVSMLSDIIRTESDPDSWYVAARRRATTVLQCKERQWHELQTGVTYSGPGGAPRWADGFGVWSAEDEAARGRDFAPSREASCPHRPPGHATSACSLARATHAPGLVYRRHWCPSSNQQRWSGVSVTACAARV